jgi:hypothetical protein
MKKVFLLMAIASMAFTSCDKITEIENFAVGHPFEQSFLLDIKDSDPSEFFTDYNVDVSSNKDFADNLDKISGYTIKSLFYRVASFEGDDATTSTGAVQFFNDSSPLGSPIDLGLISFKALADSGNNVDIPLSDDLLAAIQDNLLSNNAIRVVLYGAVSNKPVKSEIVMTIEIEALVKVK